MAGEPATDRGEFRRRRTAKPGGGERAFPGATTSPRRRRNFHFAPVARSVAPPRRRRAWGVPSRRNGGSGPERLRTTAGISRYIPATRLLLTFDATPTSSGRLLSTDARSSPQPSETGTRPAPIRSSRSSAASARLIPAAYSESPQHLGHQSVAGLTVMECYNPAVHQLDDDACPMTTRPKDRR